MNRAPESLSRAIAIALVCITFAVLGLSALAYVGERIVTIAAQARGNK